MKKTIYISIIAVLIAFLWSSCEPQMQEGPTLGAAPDSTQLSFEVTQLDPWTYQFVNTTDLVGIASWDLGNGSKISNQDTVEANYGSKGTFEVSMTFVTDGGQARTSTEVEVTQEPPFDYANDPLAQTLTKDGDQRTWKIDAQTPGHLGVAAADAVEPIWWSAPAWDKEGTGMYTDEFTFVMQDRDYQVDAHGKTLIHVNALDEGQSVGYYGSVVESIGDDRVVNVDDSQRGDIQWSLRKEDGTYTIALNNHDGVLGYDAGGSREYTVLDWEENGYIYVKNIDESGISRFHRLIPTDLIKQITFEVDTVPTGNPNEYTFSISNVEKIPSNLEVESLSWNFGDGETMEASGPDASVTHTYMRAGTYTATATVVGGGKEFTASATMEIANNHPDYETYYIDSVMVTYEDFGETSLTDMGVNIPGEASLEKVQNPDDSRYPNRSQYVGKVTKNAGSEVGGALFQLPTGYKFDLRDISTFKVKVYADTAHTITMKLLNSNKGNSAWLSMAFVSKKIDVVEGWQVLEFDFAGVQAGFNQSWADPSQYEPDVTAADRYNHNYYDKIEIVANDGNANGPYIFYMDDLEGPHVEGLK